MLNKPTFIFFDLDDTLTQDAMATQQGVDVLFQKYFTQPIENRHELWQQALDLYYPDFLAGNISSEELIRQRMRFITNDTYLTNTKADSMFMYFMEHYIKSTQLYDDVINSLEHFRAQGIRLGVISNGPDNMQQQKIDAAGIRHYFEHILTAEKAGVGKPDSRIFQQALEHVNLPAEQCWYVGDHLEKDAIAASHAGLVGIWLNRNNQQGSSFDGLSITSLNTLMQ